ncbi:MAG: hypothetical protein RL264_3110 [Bacteroidota bacterium]|jgi:galactoside O-acetyltransferase
MLQHPYLTEHDLQDFGFKSLGKNVRISSGACVYGAENISIGDNVRIDDFVILSAKHGHITIGNHVFIARSCHLSGYYGIELHDFTTLAANITIYSASDDYLGRHLTNQVLPLKYTARIGGPVILEKHVIIGCGSTIIGGVIINEGASVGAMSLVNKDLESWGVYVGIPCKRIREREKNLLELEKEFLLDYQNK